VVAVSFIFYDDLVRESGRQSMRREQRPAQDKGRKPAQASGNPDDDRRREEAQARRDKAVELAMQTFEALYAERGETGKIWASVLKEAIKRRKPDFSESYYGFRSFGGLLEEMQSRGFLKMGRDEKSNSYVYRSGGAEGSPAAAEPAVPEVLPITHRAGEAEPRGRGGRGRGSRREAPQRHDYEPVVALETRPAAQAQDEDDDAAERFADAARASMATRDVNPPDEPAPDAETYVSDKAVEAEEAAQAEEAAAREGGARRGGRGGRGRGAARKNAGTGETPVAAPAPAPAAAPAPAEPRAETPAAKTPRARKTPAAKAPAAKKAAARPARKTKAARAES